MTEPRRLELAWLFGLYARVIPPPGENGDEMSFAYDGATFTPGELVGDSGSRTVDIELTLGGNAITSGTFMVWLDNDTDGALTGFGTTDTVYIAGVTDIPSDNIFNNITIYYAIVQAAEGHATFEITCENSGAAAADIYLYVLLPTGAFAVSDAISVPGVGA